jgi:PPK2 family polyphosphate:nucleotide phosphotransferase
MKLDDLIAQAQRLSRPYRVEHGKRFRLANVDPRDRGGFKAEDKVRAQEALQLGVSAIADLQDKLYAQDRWAVLLVFQAIDAAGKDSAIKHVMSGVNPQGCQVYSFKAPSSEDLDHDYLWRSLKALPERGRIGIFNRSYYEELVVVRVHKDLLERQKVPRQLLEVDDLWKQRSRDICNFEDYLSRNGTLIRKFFLHVSRKEQGKRFLERLDRPEKNWKFSAADLRERDYWPQYQEAYEDMIRRTATPSAPWYVVPADHKWFTRIVVAAAIVDGLAGLDLAYPEVSAAQREEIARAKQALDAGDNGQNTNQRRKK